MNVGTTGATTSFLLQGSPNICTNYDNMLFLCLGSTSYATDTTALGGGPGSTTTVGDFVVRNTDCPYPSQPSLPVISTMVGPPSICQFEVGFAPVASGARSQAMTFIDTGGPTGTLQLTGTGIAPSSTAPITAPRKKCKKKRTAAAAKKKCKKAKALS